MKISTTTLILLACFTALVSSSDMRESAIEERTKPMGSICLKGDGCDLLCQGRTGGKCTSSTLDNLILFFLSLIHI